jgi:hypothetical protein
MMLKKDCKKWCIFGKFIIISFKDVGIEVDVDVLWGRYRCKVENYFLLDLFWAF